jgi:hypothetical protein
MSGNWVVVLVADCAAANPGATNNAVKDIRFDSLIETDYGNQQPRAVAVLRIFNGGLRPAHIPLVFSAFARNQ